MLDIVVPECCLKRSQTREGKYDEQTRTTSEHVAGRGLRWRLVFHYPGFEEKQKFDPSPETTLVSFFGKSENGERKGTTKIKAWLMRWQFLPLTLAIPCPKLVESWIWEGLNPWGM